LKTTLHRAIIDATEAYNQAIIEAYNNANMEAYTDANIEAFAISTLRTK
jgi:hypothetical protein